MEDSGSDRTLEPHTYGQLQESASDGPSLPRLRVHHRLESAKRRIHDKYISEPVTEKKNLA